MRKVGDLMKELGFRPEGSDDVKKAFIKNLVKTAYGENAVDVSVMPTSSEKSELTQALEETDRNGQMSFDDQILGTVDPVKALFPHRKKSNKSS